MKTNLENAAAYFAEQNPKKETIYQKMKDGDNTFRLLPPYDDECNGVPFVVRHGHWINGKAVGCLGEDCPICAKMKTLQAQFPFGSEDARSVYSKYGSKKNYIWNSVSNGDKEPKILSVPQTVQDDLDKALRDPEVGDFTDIDKGYDVTLTRSGSPFPKYKTSVSRKATAVKGVDFEKLHDLRAEATCKETMVELQALADQLS